MKDTVSMETKYVKSISSQVYRQFPELSGVKPKVRLQSGEGDRSKYLLTFSSRVELPQGKTLSRSVRVVASAQGSIIKITTSK
jgi:hypothetical protein